MSTSAFRVATLYAGPGETYLQTGILNPGVEVTIKERNGIGNWLYVVLNSEDNNPVLGGWVMTGYLNINPDLRFSRVQVNIVLADADPSTVNSRSMAKLYAVPLLSPISEKMNEVYKEGKILGRQPEVISKVGDSLSADPLYLNPISQDDFVLGPYDYLEDTINFFDASDSTAARVGMTSLVIFDPFWADKAQCYSGETPLACEYRLKRPSVAFIMFGSNDVMHMTDAEFKVQMRQIVDETLAQGIIPILSTFSYHPDAELWWQSVNFNLAVVDLAAEYEVPLINLWAAARSLPDYGLDEDNVHLLHSGFDYLKFDKGQETWYGASLRNLLSIRMLDELRRTLKMDED